MKLTRHNGRTGKNGVYNPKHNDRQFDEYSRAVTPQIRQTGNRLSGNAETAYASLLA